LVARWRWDWLKSERTGGDPDFTVLDTRILARFDRLVELNADHSFVGRRMAVWAIGDFKYALIGVTGLSVLLGLGITLFLGRQIMTPLRSAVSAADRIAAGEFETQIPESDADETGVLLHSMSVMQDNIRAMVHREKLRAESAEMRLARALETSGEGVVLLARDRRILLANRKMGDFFPSVIDRLVSGSDFFETLDIARRDLADGHEFPMPSEMSDDPRPRSLGSAEYQLRDGRWLRTTGSRTEDGCLIFFVSDFTALKEREDNFRRAQEAAEAASAAKTRFLTNISHELRTPLNAIIGFSELIYREMFGSVGDKRYVSYAADIQRGGRHLLDIINAALELSRSDAGKQLLKAEVVDLRYLLRDCSKMMGEQFASAEITLDVAEPADEALVWGEKAKLRQIILNLLSNAMKFTDAGGVVSVSVRSVAAALVVDVVDTGIGMTPEHVRIALTPFGQVDNRLDRKYEGTGLGLPLAKSLTELHGGTLEIESMPGKGTAVHVRLPDIASHAMPTTNIAAA
jgi:signal transduction histidine kinase